MTRTPGLRGLLPAKATDLPLLHTLVVSGADQSVPKRADVSHGFENWLMLGNGPDRTLTINDGRPVGDCFFAALYHGLMVKALTGLSESGGTFRPGFALPTANEVVGLYLGYQNGLPPGQSSTHGPDNGTVLADGLAWLQKAGIIKRYGPVDHRNTTAVKQALIAHKGVLVGVNLDGDAEQEFAEGQPWRELHDPTAGGHAIYEIAYDPDDDTFITWGADQKATLAWDADQVTEAFWFQAPWEDDAPGFDFGPLDAKLAAA